mgnify:CR=1 FL=1
MKNVLVLTGAGQIGLAIVRSIGSGMKIVVSDKSAANAASAALLLNNAGFDAVEHSCDISSKESVAELIKFSKELGPITAFVNAAGVSPSQASIETILKVDLYGTAMLIEEIGKVIEPNGVGVTISSQSGHRMPALGEEKDRLLATTPVEELLSLDFLQRTSLIRCTRTSLPNDATLNALWLRRSNGEQRRHASTPFLRELSLRRWLLMSSTDREATSIRRCLRRVRQEDPVLLTKLQI